MLYFSMYFLFGKRKRLTNQKSVRRFASVFNIKGFGVVYNTLTNLNHPITSE